MNLIIATPEHIVHVDTEKNVDEFSRFWATGSGHQITLGAIEALYETPLSAKEIAEQALSIVCKYDLHSNKPCHTALVE